MTKWVTKKLGELVVPTKGRLTSQSDYYVEDWLPLINTTAIDGEPNLWADPTDGILCNTNDVLMLWDGERSGLVITNKEGVVGSTFARFRPQKEIDGKYIYYYLSNRFDWIQNRRTGTGVPHAPKDLMRILDITYPESLAEQRRIAGILSSADGAIAASEALIAKYRNIKRGLLTTLLQPKEGWKKVKLGECCEIGDGLHGTPKYDDTGEYYFINGNNIKDGIINIKDDTEKVDEEVYNKHKIALTRETILMSINGTIGNLAYYNDEKVVLGKSVAYFMIQKSIIIDYLYYYLQSCEANNYFDLCLTGSTIKNLGLTQLRDMTVYIPDLAEQHRIAGILSSVDAKIAAEEKVVEKYKGVKKGLMEEMMGSGK